MRLVIEPGLASTNCWRDLWHYRELLYFLAWRDLAVRYKQTVIGVAWVLVRPAMTMVAFVAFRRLMRAPDADVPDSILVFSAVLPWQFFATALLESSNSVIANGNLLSKVYFPRLLIPFAAVVTSLADLVVTLGMLAVLMLVHGIAPTASMLLLPAFIALAFALAVGGGLWLSALSVRYRDFRYIVPFIVQVGLFVSPVAFTMASLPDRWRPLVAFNPVAGIIEGFRWAILGDRVPVDLSAIATSLVVTVVAFWFGVSYFRKTERGFADLI
jgi:lipopolysaccharide transport system permease protein